MYTHASEYMYTYICVRTNISRYDPYKSVGCVCVWVWVDGSLPLPNSVAGIHNQPTGNTETSSPIYYLFLPKTHTSLWPIPLTMNSPRACPNAASTGPHHSSGWNSCHSVMADSGDTFRPKALSLKAPVALSHPQCSAMTSPRPGTLFPPCAQTGHASFRTNTVEGEPWLRSQG